MVTDESKLAVLDAAVTSLATATETETNDSRPDATLVSLNTEATGELTSGDVDWFGFDVDSETDLTVEVTRDTGDGVAALSLYGPDGFRDQVYVGGDTARVTELVSTTGTYFVALVDLNGGTGSYTLTVTDGTQETATATPTPTATATPTPTATATPIVDDDYGDQDYGFYGFGGTE
ncbi:hypothetical protein N0B31_20000 [Salinirubellus salinus]|uniref:Peptidase C-terminal archaeal/bacterial domain-containing protein n=1 Tax=Salinirubellus salinus TaxID=1364945 RepID=A0A9E7R2R0_9EURY|nr:hypothetical protein [Salinirubellus salinus]UWM54388.1 hypothetical protein N0B31_20000 [Salinirubellus salinus]